MVLVEGNACAAVVHNCLRNRPGTTICEAWETGVATCYGPTHALRFCQDRYEWPNHAGTYPQVMITWEDAQQACNSVGKRLCGNDEWTYACEGPAHRPEPYGWVRDATKCNIDRRQARPEPDATTLLLGSPAVAAAEMNRVDQREPAGVRRDCVSVFGAYNLTDNADEWVANATMPQSYSGKTIGPRLFQGGHWVSGARNFCRAVTTFHSKDPQFRYYAEGFRCCAEADPQIPSFSAVEEPVCN
jgi:formylglycine-generating enzyme required for sulfatase activity